MGVVSNTAVLSVLSAEEERGNGEGRESFLASPNNVNYLLTMHYHGKQLIMRNLPARACMHNNYYMNEFSFCTYYVIEEQS